MVAVKKVCMLNGKFYDIVVYPTSVPELVIHNTVSLDLQETQFSSLLEKWTITHLPSGYAVASDIPCLADAFRLLKAIQHFNWSGEAKVVVPRLLAQGIRKILKEALW